MRHKWLVYFAVTFLILTLVLLFKNLWQGSALVKPPAVFDIRSPLEKVVQNSFAGAKGTYAVIIKNMKTGESFLQNPDMEFEPGSLYKLWLMALVFENLAKGKIEEGEILQGEVAKLNREFEIDETEAEFTDGTITLSVKDAIYQMITISHNYAALLLLQKIKTSNLKAYIKQIGLVNSDTGIPPKTTAKDVALFFEKLYQRELASFEYSERMIKLLAEQKLTGGLPKYLPKEIKVVNKTGDIDYFKHDGGIVFTPRGDFVIVVLSKTTSPSGAQERIAQLSKAVYDYFTK